MNGQLNIVEVASFCLYLFVLVMGTNEFISKSDGPRMLAILIAVVTWPFVRKRLFYCIVYWFHVRHLRRRVGRQNDVVGRQEDEDPPKSE